jgi:hypothetical protein
MRHRSAAFLAVLASLTLGAPGPAHAAASVAVVWTSTTGAGTPGSSSIDAAPGDQLVAEIRITADAAGVSVYGVSLEFDTDLENELDLVNATELLPAGMSQLTSGVGSTQESTAGQEGNALLFEAIKAGAPGPTSTTVVAGQLTFDVTANVASDGDDVFSGKFGIQDGALDNAYTPFVPVFANASVNLLGAPVPSMSRPGMVVTALLLLLGALWTLGRRRLAAIA